MAQHDYTPLPIPPENEALYGAVEQVESGGDVNAVSPAGARGPMQLMPGTARDPGFGIAPAQDDSPQENRRVGRQYLDAMQQRYGNLDHALIAYNWGPGNTDRWLERGADFSELPEETQNYVPRVRKALGEQPSTRSPKEQAVINAKNQKAMQLAPEASADPVGQALSLDWEEFRAQNTSIPADEKLDFYQEIRRLQGQERTAPGGVDRETGPAQKDVVFNDYEIDTASGRLGNLALEGTDAVSKFIGSTVNVVPTLVGSAYLGMAGLEEGDVQAYRSLQQKIAQGVPASEYTEAEQALLNEGSILGNKYESLQAYETTMRNRESVAEFFGQFSKYVNRSETGEFVGEAKDIYEIHADTIRQGYSAVQEGDTVDGTLAIISGLANLVGEGGLLLTEHPGAVAQVTVGTLPDIVAAAKSLLLAGATLFERNQREALDQFIEEYGDIPEADEFTTLNAAVGLGTIVGVAADRFVAQGGKFLPGAGSKRLARTRQTTAGAVSEFGAESVESGLVQFGGQQDLDRVDFGEAYAEGLLGAGAGGVITGAITGTQAVGEGAQRVSQGITERAERRATEEAEANQVAAATALETVDQTITTAQEGIQAGNTEEALRPVHQSLIALQTQYDETVAAAREAKQNGEDTQPFIARIREINEAQLKLQDVVKSNTPEVAADIETATDTKATPEARSQATQSTILRMGSHPEEFTADQAKELARNGRATRNQKKFLRDFAQYKKFAEKSSADVAAEKLDGTDSLFVGMNVHAANIAQAVQSGDRDSAFANHQRLENFRNSQVAKLNRMKREGGHAQSLLNTIAAENKVLNSLTQAMEDTVTEAFPLSTTERVSRTARTAERRARRTTETAAETVQETVPEDVGGTGEEVVENGTPVNVPEDEERQNRGEGEAEPSTTRTTPPPRRVVDNDARIGLTAQAVDAFNSLDPDSPLEAALVDQGLTSRELQAAVLALRNIDSDNGNRRTAAIKDVREFFRRAERAVRIGTGQSLTEYLTERGYDTETILAASEERAVNADRLYTDPDYHTTRDVLEQATGTTVGENFEARRRVDAPLAREENAFTKLRDNVNNFRTKVIDALGLDEAAQNVMDNLIEFAQTHGDIMAERLSFQEGTRTSQRGTEFIAHINDLFMDLVSSDPDGNPVINENLFSAISTAAYNWVMTDGSGTFFNSKSDILSILSRDTNQSLTPEEFAAYGRSGMPAHTVAEQLGTKAMNILGLRAKDSANEEHLAQLRLSIGMHALDALIEQGVMDPVWIVKTNENGVTKLARVTDKMPKTPANGQVIRHVRVVTDMVNNREVILPELKAEIDVHRDSPRVLDDLTAFQFEAETLFKSPEDIPPYTTDANGKPIPQRQIEALTKASSEPHTVKHDVLGVLKQLGDFSEELLGSLLGAVDVDSVHKDRVEGAISLNTQVFKDYENALEVAEQFPEDTPMYFRHKVVRNGRMHMVGSFFNPQASKIVRHLVKMNAWNMTVDMRIPEQADQFRSAVSEAFGFDVDKKNQDRTNEFFEKLRKDPVIKDGILAVRRMMKGKAKKGDQEKVAAALDGGGMAKLDGLVNLSKMTLSKPFEADLFREVDGITNGTAIGLMQYMGAENYNKLKEMLARTGIGMEEALNSMGEWFQDTNNKDSYQDLTQATLQYVESADLTDEKYGFSHEELSGAMQGANYLLDTDSDAFMDRDTGIVGKKGRNFSKWTLMIANYGAGDARVMQELINPVKEALIDKLEEISTLEGDAREAAIRNLENAVDSMNILEVNQKFQVSRTNPIDTQIPSWVDQNTSLVMSLTYGKGVISHLKKEYGHMKDRSQYLNDMVGTAWTAFQAMYQHEADALLSTKSGEAPSLTNADVKQILDKLEPYAPVVASALSNAVEDGTRTGIWFDGSEKGTLFTESISNVNQLAPEDQKNVVKIELSKSGSGRQNSMVMPISGRKPVEPGVSPAVRLIQSMDSASMVELILKQSVMNIHDAQIGNALGTVDITQDFNEGFFGLNRDYSVMRAGLDTMQRTLRGYRQITGDENLENLSFRGGEFVNSVTNEVVTVPQFIGIAEQIVNLVETDRKTLYPLIKSVLQYNAEKGAFYPQTDVELAMEEIAAAVGPEEFNGVPLNTIPPELKYDWGNIEKELEPQDLATLEVGTPLRVRWDFNGNQTKSEVEVTSVGPVKRDGGRQVGMRNTKTGKEYSKFVMPDGSIPREKTRVEGLAPARTEEVKPPVANKTVGAAKKSIKRPATPTVTSATRQPLETEEDLDSIYHNEYNAPLREALEEGRSFNQMLDVMIQYYGSSRGDKVRFVMAQAIKRVSLANPPTFRLLSREQIKKETGKEILGQYRPAENEILIQDTAGVRAETVMHEMLHATFSSVITTIQEKSNKSPEDVALLNQLANIRRAAERHINANEELKAEFGRDVSNVTADIHELISWGMTNQRFQTEVLDQIQVVHRGDNRFITGMRAIVDAFSRIIFGANSIYLDSPTMVSGMDALIRSTSQLVDEAFQANEKIREEQLNDAPPWDVEPNEGTNEATTTSPVEGNEQDFNFWLDAALEAYTPRKTKYKEEKAVLVDLVANNPAVPIEKIFADRRLGLESGMEDGDVEVLNTIYKNIHRKASKGMGSSTGNTRAGDFQNHAQDVTADNTETIFDELSNLGSNHDTPDHQSHLRGLLKTINKNLLAPLKLHRRKTRPGEESSAEVYFDESAIYMAVAKNKQHALEMSPEELYVHELLHVVVRNGIEGTSVASSELNNLYKRAKEFIKPEDFLNDLSQVSDLAAMAAAQARYDYIFNNPGTEYIETNLYNGTQNKLVKSSHLHEFAVIGATNANFRRALGRMDARAPNKQLKGMTTAEKIMEIVNRFLHLMSDLVTRRSGQKADAYLIDLIEKLAAVENSQKKSIHRAADGISDSAVNGINTVVDKTVSSLTALTESRLVQGGPVPVQAAGNVAGQVLRGNTNNLLRATRELAKKMGLQHDGIINSIASEVRGATPNARNLHRMVLKANKMIDQTRTKITTSYTKYLNNMFKESYSEEFMGAATRALLSTDFEVLVTKFGLQAATRLLNDPKFLGDQITAARKELNKNFFNEYNFYSQMAEGLGFYQAKGRALKRHVLLNAVNIAEMQGTGLEPSGDVQAATEAIDVLASLFAIKYSNQADKDQTFEMINNEVDWENPNDPNNAINAIIASHREMKAQALERTFGGNPRMMQKGYTKETFNPNVEIQVADETKGAELVELGYEKLGAVKQDPAMPPTKQTMHMYVLREGAGVKYMSGAVSTTGKNVAGTTLMGVNEQANQTDPALGAFIDTLAVRRSRRQDIMDIVNGTATNAGPDENILVPIVNENGATTGYRYTMSTEAKRNLLDRHDNISHVLGASFANIADKVNTKSLNEELMQMAYDTYREQYRDNPEDFIVLSPKHRNKEYQDQYRMLPSDTRRFAKQLFGGDRIFIHKDHHRLMFGYRAFSVSQLNKRDDPNARGYDLLKQEMNNAMVKMFNNRVGRNAEAIWQEIVRTVKDSIVIKSVVVTTANIGSNTVLLKMLGVPAKDVIRDQAIAYRGAVKYQQDSFKIFELEQELARGVTGSRKAKVEQDIRELRNELRVNPVRELIEAGVLQTIVDDVNMVEDPFSYKSSLDKKLEPFLNKAPETLVNAGKIMAVTHDTQFYRVLRDAAQLSDFAARYTLHKYNTQTRKNPMSTQESLDMVVDTFVNYDLPTHKSLQYMNDMGMVMFTKYYMRTQRVILQLAKDKPANLLIALMAQNLFFDIPDISDSFFTESSIIGKFNVNPIDVLEGAAETAPINLIF